MFRLDKFPTVASSVAGTGLLDSRASQWDSRARVCCLGSELWEADENECVRASRNQIEIDRLFREEGVNINLRDYTTETDAATPLSVLSLSSSPPLKLPSFVLSLALSLVCSSSYLPSHMPPSLCPLSSRHLPFLLQLSHS